MTPNYPKKILVGIEDYFKKEKERLVKRLAQIDESDPFLDPDHANDNADIGIDVREEMAHQHYEANRNQLKKRLAEIDEVLERIDKGNYGVCKECGKMIDTDRLSSNPLATLCIDCAKK